MSDKVQIDAGVLATLVACAKDHIQDIETGIQEGLYDKADNADLETKKAALNTASLLVPASPDEKKAKLREALGQGKSVDTTHGLYIKIAADTIALLRKVDVFRVIDSVRPDNIDGVSRSTLANWIKAKRPDLGTEVDEVMAELA